MSFQSFEFLALLTVTVTVCRTVGGQQGRRLLLLASVVSYLWGVWDLQGGGPRLLAGTLVVLLGAQVTRLCGRRLLAGPPGAGRRWALAGAAAWHVAVLLVFKYTDFFTGGAVSIGWAPLGLSFFTFQQLWTLRELSKGAVQASWLQGGDFLLYTFFFPTVSSGPILKPQAFFPQLEGSGFLCPSWEDLAAGLYAICCGMAEKVLLADAFGVAVDNGWARAGELSAPAAWLVILGYTLQLYFDFSGYCDIATGAARLLGIRLPANFDSPYRALSVGDFWKRWHITLTSFLRECVYFPLGGSRGSAARTYRNILLIFLISGFWHGAGWTFLLWGALHGMAQIAERACRTGRERLPGWLRWAATFLFVNLAWVFFRAPSLSAAGTLFTAAFTGGMAAPEPWLLEGLLASEMEAVQTIAPALAPVVQAIAAGGLYLLGLMVALAPGNTISRMDTFRPTWWRCVSLAVLLSWSILSFTGITTFIYSDF